MAQKKRGTGPAQQAARMGAGAALLGTLAWLTGGFTWQNVLDWGKTLLIAGSLALFIRWAVAEPYKIPSGSMEPTLHGNPAPFAGDRVFVNKWIYGLRWPLNDFRIPWTTKQIHYADTRMFRWKEPQRFDIVVFKTIEHRTMTDTLVKRVIGLPGERVLIRDGRVYIDGKALELPDSMPEVKYTSNSPMLRYGVVDTDAYSLVPEGHYLLLGDNSGHSRDGRVWGFVPYEHLLGPVTCIWWPPSSWRDFTGFTQTWWWRSLLALLAAFLVWRLFMGRSVKVHGQSPDSDIAPKDHLYIHRASYGIPLPFTNVRLTQGRAPKRGELVLYQVSVHAHEPEHLLLGRIAGIGGDHVELAGGKLKIDGKEPAEKTLQGRTFEATADTGPYGARQGAPYRDVPPGSCFILAENPEAAVDSRTLGWIPNGALLGPATAVWWPLRRRRRL